MPAKGKLGKIIRSGKKAKQKKAGTHRQKPAQSAEAHIGMCQEKFNGKKSKWDYGEKSMHPVIEFCFLWRHY